MPPDFSWSPPSALRWPVFCGGSLVSRSADLSRRNSWRILHCGRDGRSCGDEPAPLGLTP